MAKSLAGDQELENMITAITCELYNYARFAKTDVQFIIRLMQKLIRDYYNPYVKNKVNALHNLPGVKVEDYVKIESDAIFDSCQDPFEDMDTEKKRLSIYEDLKMYTEPEMYVMKNEFVAKFRGNDKCVFKKDVSIVHFDLQKSVTNLLEISGLFEATIANMKNLECEKHVMSNFVQGKLWKDLMNKFNKKDGIPMPLNIFFDDFEPGNALGSHSGANQIGAVYASIPC